MPDNLTGTQELIFAVLGPLILLGAILYGTMKWRKQSAAQRQASDDATRRVYAEEDAKEHGASFGGSVSGNTHMDAPPMSPDGTRQNTQEAPHQSRPNMTEDEMQQRALGGVKGSPNLQAAPLTEKERLNTFS